MRVLDLFSGTGSIKKALNSDDTCVSLDINRRFGDPDIEIDILEWDYKSAFNPGDFDVIFAGCPCTEYSHLRETTKHIKPPDIEYANKLVQKTLEIFDYFKPKFWFIENPDSGKLKNQPFMEDLPYTRVSYCMYGFAYRKNTRIWTNSGFKGNLCDGKNSCGKMVDGRHGVCIGQKNWVSRDQRNSYPSQLVNDIIEHCRQNLNPKGLS